MDALLKFVNNNEEPESIQDSIKHSLLSFVNGCLMAIPEQEVINFSVRAIQAIKDLRDEFVR